MHLGLIWTTFGTHGTGKGYVSQQCHKVYGLDPNLGFSHMLAEPDVAQISSEVTHRAIFGGYVAKLTRPHSPQFKPSIKGQMWAK